MMAPESIPVFIFELDLPGNCIQSKTDQAGRKINDLFNLAVEAYMDCAAILWMYSSIKIPTVFAENYPFGPQSLEERTAMHEIVRRNLESRGQPSDYQNIEEIVSKETKREAREAGFVPRCYALRRQFLMAQLFAVTFHRMVSFLTILSKLPEVPREVKEEVDVIKKVVPDLNDIRHSIAHFEDRAQGLDKNKRQIEHKSTEFEFPTEGGGAIRLDVCSSNNNLVNHHYLVTLHDGRTAEIPVTAALLELVGKQLQAIINAFVWVGSPTSRP